MRKIKIWVSILLIGYLFVSGRLIAIPYRFIFSDSQLLSQQLQGDGCWFYYDKDSDGFCDFEWSYFHRAVRNPEYHCPMQAARCIAKQPRVFAELLPDLKSALTAQPAQFDTGDGIIMYRECFEEAIREVESPLK